MAPKESITGFNPRHFAAASGQPYSDPWKRAESWRYTGPFTRAARFRGLFPGFGTATVLFAAYCGYEYLFLKEIHGHEHVDLDSHGGEGGATKGM